VADIYDALRTVRPYRPAMSVAKACSILLQEAMSGKLDRGYVSSFLTLLEVLSPGRSVVLSDGTRAVILTTREKDPLAPTVEREDGHTYDLDSSPGLSILGVEEETA
jgi:HD-GYP domain-containing protein (c-di-GMP phosphodiesterase class II)